LGLATTIVYQLICVALGALIVEKNSAAGIRKHLHHRSSNAA